MPVKPALIPSLSYGDAPAAIDFLCEAFGFTRHAVYGDDEDASLIHHAQLVKDGNMVMLSTTHDNEWTRAANMSTPRAVGANTMALYVVIDDVDAHCERARAAGATIIREPRDEEYGGRGYGALDCEGYAWSFGSYDPFASASGG